MSLKTDNFKLYKYEDNDIGDLRFINDSMDLIDKGINPFYVATQSSTNVYKVTTGLNKTSLANGYSVKVAIPIDSTGAVSLVIDSCSAVAVKKSNGGAVTNFKANGVYSLTYYNSVFILASGGGADTVTFTSDKLLTGYSANDSNGEKVNGAMPNKAAVTASLNCGGSYTIPAGYHNGSGKVTANSLASQTSANATAKDIIKGKTAWVNGSKLTGTATIQTSSLIKSGSAIVAGAGSNLGTFTGGLKIIFTYEVATSNVYVSFFDPSARNGTLPFRLIKNNADLFDTSITTNIHGSVYWYWYNNELLINRGSASSYDGKEFKYKIFDLGYTMSSIKSF